MKSKSQNKANCATTHRTLLPWLCLCLCSSSSPPPRWTQLVYQACSWSVSHLIPLLLQTQDRLNPWASPARIIPSLNPKLLPSIPQYPDWEDGRSMVNGCRATFIFFISSNTVDLSTPCGGSWRVSFLELKHHEDLWSRAGRHSHF